MSGLEMLDAFIGLVGIYLTLSLLVTAIGEGISQALGLRGRNLRQVMLGLIGETGTEKFYTHPRIRQLMQYDDTMSWYQKTKFKLGFAWPSYIPADIASEVLLELQLGTPLSQLRQSPLEIGKRLAQLSSSHTKTTLSLFWEQAEADSQKFQLLVQDWFNDRGDRAVGWFKRQLGTLQLGIGLVVAVGMNVDSITLYQKLFSDPIARQQALQLAESLTKQPELVKELCQDSPPPCLPLKSMRAELSKTAPILGPEESFKWPNEAPQTWIGYLLTAFALSLGAPFWFDILQKLMAVKQKFRPANAETADPGHGSSAAETVSGTGVIASTAAKQPDPLSLMDLQLARLSALVYLDGPRLALELQTFLLSGELRSLGNDSQYLYACGADYDVLICRGTEQKLEDVLTNAQYTLVQWPKGSQSNAHQGFNAQADAILAHLQQTQPKAGLERPLWIAGHSLGGALAVLLALQLSKTSGIKLAGLVTFGQPKVGDAALAQSITQQLLPYYRRYVNQRDIVPQLPPLPGYQHSGQLCYFDDLGQLHRNPARWLMLLDQALCTQAQAQAALHEYVSDHKMKNYVSLLARQVQPPA